MNFFYVFVLFAAIVVTTADVIKTQKCRNFPPVIIDYQKLVQYGPFLKFQGTELIYKCSQISFTNYVGSRSCYTGQAIIIANNKTMIYDLTLEDNSIFRTTLCSDGSRVDFRFIAAKLCNITNAFHCLATCDKDGDAIEDVICSGRTYKDSLAIDNFLRNELKVNVSKKIYDLQEGCPKPPFCYSY